MAEHYQRKLRASSLPKQILELAFAKLPKLRNVRMGDFRNLAAIGETPDKLCGRLFGVVLRPEFCQIDSPHRNILTDFHFLLEMCCNREQADLQSISIGGHPYCVYSSEHSSIDSFDHRPAIALDADFDLLLADKTTFEKLCNLKNLQLPLNIVQTIHADHMTQIDSAQYCQRSSFVKPLLEACCSSLTSLELTAEDTGLITTSWRGREADEARLEKSASFLIQVPFSMRFASLRYLELCGWLFTEHAIKGFLLQMKSTLRELRLLDNLIMDKFGATSIVGR
ncbi:hypothetical protein Slin14017_G082730 [Septoria linicola]|nr:hypothetical protein Slin14017_G082730 [Septoria linicola]